MSEERNTLLILIQTEYMAIQANFAKNKVSNEISLCFKASP